MSQSFKSESYNSDSPYLIVSDAAVAELGFLAVIKRAP